MAFQGKELKSTSINGVKMYTLIGQQKSSATWIPPKKIRALRKDKSYMERVDLIQDLRFETATTRIKATPDGEFLIASGIYPPQVKVYELRELSLKFERHLISEIITFEVLGDDYSKLAFLCADRSVNLHAKYGSHYSLRIPRMGRDMIYDSWSCDLLCAASSPELYRINLEQGRFLASLNTQSPALNVVSRSKYHGLVAGGGEDGAVECFDMRIKSSVARLDVSADEEVTAVEFDGDGGFHMAVGSSGGKVMIYDLRSSTPLRVKDHMYGSPIINIKWHKTLNSERPKLITTDKHIVRIWDPETGDGMTSIEPTAGAINDMCVFGESGLMLLALDTSQIPSYFLPALGPAPKWCSYLERLTEEMEEDQQTSIYDDYKFLTKEELEKLNLTNLIGTNLLRAYMHGFFIDFRLYKKAQAAANPIVYEEYIEKRKREKEEEERSTRITIKRKLPKVNRNLAKRLLEDEEFEANKKDIETVDAKKPSKKKRGLTSEVFEDKRFIDLFKKQDFEVDENSAEYLALHPLAAPAQKSLVKEHFVPYEEDEDQSDSDAEDDQSSDDEPANGKSKDGKKSRAPRLYEVKDERHAEAFNNRKSLAREDALPLEERVKALSNSKSSNGFNKVKAGLGGSREISFISRGKAKYEADDYRTSDEPYDDKREKEPIKVSERSEGIDPSSLGGSSVNINKDEVEHPDVTIDDVNSEKEENATLDDNDKISEGDDDYYQEFNDMFHETIVTPVVTPERLANMRTYKRHSSRKSVPPVKLSDYVLDGKVWIKG
ncbi:embryo sac development arrest 7 [Artemisia annua]|uniref:Embryo sac development arrest 7 n=1 Tax=Artemisia annua TaxID=35608 RepID=A0A2U1LTS7_ARTAN|nr:embryo sac development arrest 7 [Artemisia annua]